MSRRGRRRIWLGILAWLLGWTLLLWPGAALAQEGATARIHEVAWGETLFGIAQRYGVSVPAILEANDLDDADHIYAGQQLIIPGVVAAPLSPSLTHTVQPGENLFRISIRYGLTVEQIMATNNLRSPDEIYVGQVLVISVPTRDAMDASASSEEPPPLGQSHVVQLGETLYGIAQEYAVSVEALSAANHLLNPSQLYVGQILAIPGAATSTDTGYTPAQSSSTHQVQSGETLFSIARQYGVSIWILAQVNSISNLSLLYAGQMLTIPVSEALSQGGDEAPVSAGKSIMVDISEQRTYAFENGELLWTFVVSTGIAGADTWLGEFSIQNKIPMAYAATWDLQMPWWMGFYWAGPLQNGFHALPILSNGLRLWAGLLGQPASYGCVILDELDAQTLYNWAEIGTPVSVVP